MKTLTPIWFDIDGTLLHTRVGHGAFQKALREVYGWEESMETVRFAGNTDLRVLMDLSHHHAGDPEHAMSLRHEFFQRMAAHLDEGLAADKPDVVPGARELVAALLEELDLSLALLTGNARDCAYVKLRHIDLHDSFPDGGFGDEHADRNILASRSREAIVAKLPAEVDLRPGWVIGDTPRDVNAAHTIGARCLGVASGACSERDLLNAGADRVVTELYPEADLLRLLLG